MVVTLPTSRANRTGYTLRKKLLIVGAGGFGREVYVWADHIPPETVNWSIGGFLDANPRAIEGLPFECSVLGSPECHVPKPNEVFACAVGAPRARMRLCGELKARGAEFVNIIHPTAIVGARTTLVEGVILCPYSIVTTHVRLGSFVILNLHATVGHDAIIGDGCTLSDHCDVTGHVRLGTGVFIGSHATVLPGADGRRLCDCRLQEALC